MLGNTIAKKMLAVPAMTKAIAEIRTEAANARKANAPPIQTAPPGGLSDTSMP